MVRFYSHLMALFRVVTGILFTVIIILTIAQVFCRFVLNSPLIWSEEVSRLLFVWMTMFGGPVLTWRRTHLAIPELVQSLPGRLQALIRLALDLGVIALLVVMVGTSPKLLKVSWHITSGALQLPFTFWRAAAPFGCFFMACSLLVQLPGAFRNLFKAEIRKEGASQ